MLLQGDPYAKEWTRRPWVSNLYGYYVVHNGFWGDWSDWEYCSTIRDMDSNGIVRGNKVTGFRLRIEGNQGGGDDTALNGIEVYCQTRAVKTITSGHWGDWQRWGFCPEGHYATGAQFRIEGQQGSGDDTAGNSVNLMCSNGGVVGSHGGFWGG
ncbi:hypothetical protein GPECTOR_12g374 [Gonium pectorale]|uniref:Uncharacterized protein n=1 Tax=Gonium pectorale TaxID=33097 RepID=A0A150GNU5_GONPE|nr:hypothetical protein GPECTOR_12g374 [Gonium pectorale]|eukprot:KXZ51412.1 hypothetical protein GPECTOR_12g374 [Gonium pectorale]